MGSHPLPSSSATPCPPAQGEAGGWGRPLCPGGVWGGRRGRGTAGGGGDSIYRGSRWAHAHTHTHTHQGLGTQRGGRGERGHAGAQGGGQRLRVRGAGRVPARPQLGTRLPHLAHTAVAKRAGTEEGRGGCLHLSRRVRRGFRVGGDGRTDGRRGEVPSRAACPTPALCRRLGWDGGAAAAVPAPRPVGETGTRRPPTKGDDKKERGHAGTQPNKLEAGWERGRRARGRVGTGSEPVGGALDERHFAELHHGRAGLVLHARHPLQQLLGLALGVPQLLPPLHQLGVALCRAGQGSGRGPLGCRGGVQGALGLPGVPGRWGCPKLSVFVHEGLNVRGEWPARGGQQLAGGGG